MTAMKDAGNAVMGSTAKSQESSTGDEVTLPGFKSVFYVLMH